MTKNPANVRIAAAVTFFRVAPGVSSLPKPANANRMVRPQARVTREEIVALFRSDLYARA